MILQEISEGPYGPVHLCVHRLTQTKRQVEIINRNTLSETDRNKLLKEIDMLKQFDHPNVLRLFNIYMDTSKIHMVTELCGGGELFDMIQA